MKVLFGLLLLVGASLAFPFLEPDSTNDSCKLQFGNVEEALNREQKFKALVYDPAKDVQYYLFTQKNPTKGQVVVRNNATTLKASNFNSKHQTRILIHGWISSSESISQTTVRDAYLKRGNFNVFVVDWSVGAMIGYPRAVNRVAPTGAVVGNFIHFLINSGRVNPSDISVIGHSLGAHVAGFAGKNHTRPNQIASIVGLDPAFPRFTLDDEANRLASGDAHYVETIHTDAGCLGFEHPVGEASFYPNWGSKQPGCGIDLLRSCNHARAYEYFAESINTDVHFYAVRCPEGYDQIKNKNCSEINATRKMGGEPLNTKDLGVFYLPTNEESPFAKGKV